MFHSHQSFGIFYGLPLASYWLDWSIGAWDRGNLAGWMGWLISSYYLRYGWQQSKDTQETWEGAQKINKVVFAGVPFSGVMKIFRNMYAGDAAVIKGFIIPADALNSFPSSYQLLPSAGVKAFSENNNEVMELSIHDPKNWKKYGWGFFRSVKNKSPQISETRFEFLEASLQRAQVFSQRLHAPSSSQGRKGLSKIKLLNITGKNRPTLAYIYCVKENEGFRLIYSEKQISKNSNIKLQNLFQPGDGSVTFNSSTLPQVFQESFSYQSYISSASHGDLFNEEKTREVVFDFLNAR